MGYGISQCERASPTAAKDVHLTVDIKLTAQPQNVIDQMCGRVVGECRRGIVVACAGCAFATAALVEKNDPVSRWVEKVGMKFVANRAARRSRANLRPRSRSASVIDRLLKNQNPLEDRNNLRSSSPHPGPGQTSGEPRRNFAVRNSSTREPWLLRSPVFGSGIRRLDGEAVGDRRLARTPPRRVTRWLAQYFWTGGLERLGPVRSRSLGR